MRSWVVIVVAAVLGVVTGVGITVVQALRSGESFSPIGDAQVVKSTGLRQPGLSMEAREFLAGAKPKAHVIGERSYNFGTMERFATQSHTFEIKNIGTAPLKLEKGNTSCKCTLSNMSGTLFLPGQTAKVTLEWTTKTQGPQPTFEQTALIHTNDPDQETIELTIRGYLTEVLRVLPSVLALGSVSSNKGMTTHFRLYGFRSPTIEILKTKFTEEKTAPYFSLQFEPMPEEEVKQEKGAECGLLASLAIKPGLPLGPINQRIEITADVGKEVTVAVVAQGTVASDIVIASSKQYLASKNFLRLGLVNRKVGAKVALHVFVKGPHRRDVKFSVGSMEPQGYFKVDIGPPKEINKGKALSYLITIEVPAGLAPLDRLGAGLTKYGEIVLKTTHPQTKEIPIKVKFAVE